MGYMIRVRMKQNTIKAMYFTLCYGSGNNCFGCSAENQLEKNSPQKGAFDVKVSL